MSIYSAWFRRTSSCIRTKEWRRGKRRSKKRVRSTTSMAKSSTVTKKTIMPMVQNTVRKVSIKTTVIRTRCRKWQQRMR